MPRYQVLIIALVGFMFIGAGLVIKPHVPKYYKLYKKQDSVSVLVVKRELTALDCFTMQVENKGTVCVRSK